uniref:Nudix hydrolase domain-containing protein n=1 Tax=Angiostrongylus cantonensis TaxID=6313 RepID=A0A0K0DC99_ANGCA
MFTCIKKYMSFRHGRLVTLILLTNLLNKGSQERTFDLVLRHSSVAILLYHTVLKKFVFVKQFRPAVLVGHILRLPENFGKQLKEIDWSKYDASEGYTLELCAGLIDKDLPTIDIMKEEIEEECTQYLFYAEIDDSMKISEGGGNVNEGEVITKVFLTQDEALAFISNDHCLGPPSMLYALLWWFAHKNGQRKTSSTQNAYTWKPKNVVPLKDFKFEKLLSSKRFVPYRMQFTLGPLTRTWDLALCDDSVSILLFNESLKELVLVQRFRPARHRSRDGIELESIDWSSQPAEWAYTLELCTGHYRKGSSEEEIEARVKKIAALKCGYALDSIHFVKSYTVGISFAGDRQRVYYAKVTNSMRIPGWKQYEDITPEQSNILIENLGNYVEDLAALNTQGFDDPLQ